MLKEFRDFINRGNVVDLAVAVMIGAAFGAITSSLVEDIITPVLGLVLQGTDFSNLVLVLARGYESAEAAIEAGAPVIRYGAFLNTVFNFLLVALVLFMVVRSYNQLRRRFAREEEMAPEAPPAPSREEVILSDIRDLLAAQQQG